MLKEKEICQVIQSISFGCSLQTCSQKFRWIFDYSRTRSWEKTESQDEMKKNVNNVDDKSCNDHDRLEFC